MSKSKKSIKNKLKPAKKVQAKLKIKKKRTGVVGKLKHVRDLNETEQIQLKKTLKKIEASTYYGEGLNRISGGFVETIVGDADRDTIDVTLKYGVKDESGADVSEKKIEIDRRTMDIINEELVDNDEYKEGGTTLNDGKYQTKSHGNKSNDYNIVCKIVRIDGKDVQVCYHETNDKKVKGVEVYSGANHIHGSTDPSYSRRYDIGEVPVKYKYIVNELREEHHRRFEGGGEMKSGGRVNEEALMKKNGIVLLGFPSDKYPMVVDKTIDGQIAARKENLKNVIADMNDPDSDTYPEMLKAWKKSHEETLEKLYELKKRAGASGSTTKNKSKIIVEYGDGEQSSYTTELNDKIYIAKEVFGKYPNWKNFVWNGKVISRENLIGERNLYDKHGKVLYGKAYRSSMAEGGTTITWEKDINDAIDRLVDVYENYEFESEAGKPMLKQIIDELKVLRYKSKADAIKELEVQADNLGELQYFGYFSEDGRGIVISALNILNEQIDNPEKKWKGGKMKVGGKLSKFEFWERMFTPRSDEWREETLDRLVNGKLNPFEETGDRQTKIDVLHYLIDNKIPQEQEEMASGGKAGQKKVAKVMHEFKHGKLKSHGRTVTDRDQAIAIGLSEAGLSRKKADGGKAGSILIKLGVIEQKLNNKGVFLKDFDENGIGANATFEGHDIEEYNYEDEKGKSHKLSKDIQELIDDYNQLSDDYYTELKKK